MNCARALGGDNPVAAKPYEMGACGVDWGLEVAERDGVVGAFQLGHSVVRSAECLPAHEATEQALRRHVAAAHGQSGGDQIDSPGQTHGGVRGVASSHAEAADGDAVAVCAQPAEQRGALGDDGRAEPHLIRDRAHGVASLDDVSAPPVVRRLEKYRANTRFDELPSQPFSAREGLFAEAPEVKAHPSRTTMGQVNANARARHFAWQKRRRTWKFAFVRASAKDREAAAFEDWLHGRGLATMPYLVPEGVERGAISPTASVERLRSLDTGARDVEPVNARRSAAHRFAPGGQRELAPDVRSGEFEP